MFSVRKHGSFKNKKNNPKRNLDPCVLWDTLSEMEMTAYGVFSYKLKEFLQPIRNCYGSAVQAITLKGERNNEKDIALASLFLKRSLNDLRSVWLLVNLGYTSQAATIAASLFEYAAIVVCITGNEENTKKIIKNRHGDSPWTARQLSQMIMKIENRENYELAWREKYAVYKFFCKIKHPTISSVSSDAIGTSLKRNEFVVMASPDLLNENISIKAIILTSCISDIFLATKRMIIGIHCDESTQDYKDCVGRLNNVISETIKAYKKIVSEYDLPFSIYGTNLEKEYYDLRYHATKVKN
ncbi:MAG TPA: hypothetical protein DCY12_05685 [Candidatus Atribacteria bacterium]|nr:hypothetical protein [Candidatus Atribacteria bacterium]